jgi:citrate lyase subunit beta/citryl-CoA lyase
VRMRPRRSVLYMPGSNARALEKARTLSADALILDLEDAVAAEAKDAARDQVCTAAASGAYGRREVAIRTNGLNTPWCRADIEAAAAAGADAVLVPKIDDAADIARVEEILSACGAGERTAIWAMLETPRAILGAEAICGASQRLKVLVMGTNDIAKDLGAASVPGRGPLMTSIGLCLLAARAHAKVLLDGVYNDIKDTQGFEAECRQGAGLGLDGKTLIHPSQLEPANRIFGPGTADIEEARRIIAAFEEAARAGKAVATLDGRMVESLHVETARRTVAMAEAIEALAAEQG